MKPALMVFSLAALSATGLAVAASAAPESTVSHEQFATLLGGDWRVPQNAARDQYRHPEQTLTFFGLRPDQTVIEITPGNGWYSELLAPLLRDKGHYVAAIVDPAISDYAKKSADSLKQKYAADPAHYGKVEVVAYAPQAPVFGTPGSADTVLTFRNVHNWVDAGNEAATFKAFYEVLKPGGTLGVVDHRAKPGTTAKENEKNGYLPTDYVVKLAQQAGFKLAGESEINANLKDTKDYPDGVWTLPPALVKGEQDKANYLAIGESDRMTLRFIKPDK
ncbi:class I SAM-dependent methyltransferase [Pseudomonas sp. CFBP 13711]|uniref:class I SAM-dependent methyltransferase n=1 Tax=unclassified Pseudomonas TaxID=196821 RepID=UPI00177ECE74|nr:MULTISPECIES: class I SAM-dependent methyltransferase [unclassified Pseudomonas]MBD8709783.1 class I SAM-dependent methyltransferase [Pseudomonas sp. CFBP 13711]MBD8711389.1 class I SAM-dependent methyltransferase [Pseudomonas sp. CFBP 13715]